MDFSNIKLVVSDMDGTLLNENNEVSTRFYEQFEALKKRNIHFIAASGRQFQSIVEKLAPIQHDISIIAENGGIMQHNGHTTVLLQLTAVDVSDCLKILRNIEDGYIVLCGKKTAYIETKNEAFKAKLVKYYTEIEEVDDLSAVEKDEFLKIAVFHFESSEKHIYPFVEKLSTDFKVVVSGQNWLDISHQAADKAYALKILQQEMGIRKNETLVFGDYNNDIGMMKLAEMSFAMENSHPNVKKLAKYSTKSNSEEGVEEVLAQLLASKSEY